MNDLSSSVSGNRKHSKKINAFMLSESDLPFLNQEAANDYEDAALFEIADVHHPSQDDFIPTIEIYPDFSQERSQQHYLVSPKPRQQAPSDTEAFIPIFAEPAASGAGLPLQAPVQHVEMSDLPEELIVAPAAAPPEHNPVAIEQQPAISTGAPIVHKTQINNSLPLSEPIAPPPETQLIDENSAPEQPLQQPAPETADSPAETTPVVFTSLPIDNSDALDTAIKRIVCSEPLLSEDEMLSHLKEEQFGGFIITKRSLRQALVRIGLESDSKRFRAYMSG
jgi:hypothetical protein